VKKNRLRFVLAELQLANTLLALADRDPEARARNVERAWLAHAVANDAFAMVQCSPEERAEVEAKLAAIYEQLKLHGRSNIQRHPLAMEFPAHQRATSTRRAARSQR